MSEQTSSREAKFIVIFILIASFFGLSEPTSKFFFPSFGTQVFDTINFYFLVIVAFIALNYRYVATIPPVYLITIRYIIAFPIFYFLFSFLLGGNIVIPRTDTVIIETIISFSENLLLLYLIPPVLHLGNYSDNGKNITTLLNNIRFHLPAIVIITILHAGNYALMSGTSFGSFYTSIFIAFVMFIFFVTIKEIFGFGTSEAAHAGFNSALIGIRGAII